MKIAKDKPLLLAILADPATGGWPSYTAHLAYGLREAGYDPLIVKLTKTTEKKPRDFGRGLTYWNLSMPDLLEAAKQGAVLITAIGKNKREAAAELIRLGAPVVIHDPTELDKDVIELLKQAKVITIRKIISDALAAKGIPNTYLPHPYKRNPEKYQEQRGNPVAISRVDFDKNSHLIVEANKYLAEPIIIYGTLNTLYESVRLKKADENWRVNYGGAWPSKTDLWHSVYLAAKAKAVVDLSTIKGDGGGTQYAFLEALDAETPLIIHTNWLTGNPDYDEMAPVASATVASATDLVNVFSRPLVINHDAVATLFERHNARKVASDLIELM